MNEEKSTKVWNEACAEGKNDGKGECKHCNFMGILDSKGRCEECTGFVDDYESNYSNNIQACKEVRDVQSLINRLQKLVEEKERKLSLFHVSLAHLDKETRQVVLDTYNKLVDITSIK